MVEQSEVNFLEEMLKESEGRVLTDEEISRLAARLGLKDYEAENLRSFYSNTEKSPKVCVGLPCKLAHSKFGEALPGDMKNSAAEVSCLGYCDSAPVIMREGKYFHMDAGKAVEIKGNDTDRTSLTSYLEKGGFETLDKVLKNNSADEVRRLAKDFSLEGFGGSGFPAWVKWDAVAGKNSSTKYLVVNAHEGEPGTFKDRVIMESRPFELIEAALIAARTVGAEKVIIALKHEYVQAERILKKALQSSISHIGEKLSGRNLPKISIERIPGFYITGEESALLEAIEGKRSEPRLRPPYPADVGLYGKPTLIDNVETLVYFLSLLREHYGGGTRKQNKAYCLTGDVEKSGAFFFPYGTNSEVLLKEGGKTEFANIKAVLPGGLSGGVLPAGKANLDLDFKSLRNAGAGLGTASLIAIGKNRCMVDVIDNVEKFFERESCGKCIPCRLGTKEISSLFSDLKEGKATLEDLERAEETANVMIKGSICGLGQAAGKMFLDSMKNFSNEITEHTSGSCKAGVCFEGVSH